MQYANKVDIILRNIQDYVDDFIITKKLKVKKEGLKKLKVMKKLLMELRR